jgi:hypothetical protein
MLDRGALLGREVVHDLDVAGVQGRGQFQLSIG